MHSPSSPRFGGLRNLSTMTKLLLNAAVTGVIMLLIGGVGIWGFSQLNEQVNNIGKGNLPSIVALGDTKAAFLQVGRDFRQTVLEITDQATQQALATVNTDEQGL